MTIPEWMWHHLPWLWLTAIVVPCMILELGLWGVVWLRAVSISWNPAKAKALPSGRRRTHTIDLEKARERKLSWPFLGVPLTAICIFYYGAQLLWLHPETYLALAMVWFFTTPLRKILGISVARTVWCRENPDKKLETTLSQDVHGYYAAAWGRPESAYPPAYEPSFDPRNAFFKLLIKLEKWFGRYGAFWRIWNIFRYWGVVVQALVSLAWPVTTVVVPFSYMHLVHDYKWWHRAWWRRYRNGKYESKYTTFDQSVPSSDN